MNTLEELRFLIQVLNKCEIEFDITKGDLNGI